MLRLNYGVQYDIKESLVLLLFIHKNNAIFVKSQMGDYEP